MAGRRWCGSRPSRRGRDGRGAPHPERARWRAPRGRAVIGPGLEAAAEAVAASARRPAPGPWCSTPARCCQACARPRARTAGRADAPRRRGAAPARRARPKKTLRRRVEGDGCGRRRGRARATRSPPRCGSPSAWGAVCVLKGPGTVIAAPDGRWTISGAGTSALATAGSGDVLAGVIAAFLAARRGQRRRDWGGSAAAVHLHGLAGGWRRRARPRHHRERRGPGAARGAPAPRARARLPPVIRVRVPATSANLGPGFDCLGVALGLHLRVDAHVGDPDALHYHGEGTSPTTRQPHPPRLPSGLRGGRADAPSVAFSRPQRHPTGARTRLELGRPGRRRRRSRRRHGGRARTRRRLRLDGRHRGPPRQRRPRRVRRPHRGGRARRWRRLRHRRAGRAARAGACCSACPPSSSPRSAPGPPCPSACRAATPSSPRRARRCGPSPSRATSRSLLRTASLDVLHEPYREALVPGLAAARAALFEAGAHAAYLSGAGPTLAAIAAEGALIACRAVLERFAGAGGRVLELRAGDGYDCEAGATGA
jgi:hypothetical protein